MCVWGGGGGAPHTAASFYSAKLCISFTAVCSEFMGEWDQCFWFGLGAFSGLFLEALCCWVMMGASGNGFGRLRGWAGVADFALSGVIETCPFTI